MTRPRRRAPSAATVRLAVGAALLLASLAALLAPSSWTERVWASHVQPWASALVVPATERPAAGAVRDGLGASWAWGGGVVLLAAGGIAAVAAGLRSHLRRSWKPVASLVATVVLVAGVLAVMSAVLWFPSLRRPSLQERAGLGPRPHAGSDVASPGRLADADVERLSDRLLATLARALDDAAALRAAGTASDPPLGGVGAGSPVRPTDVEPAARALARSLEQLASEIDGVGPRIPRTLKSIPAGGLLRFGFAGVVAPMTLEAHVDAALPPWAQLAVGAHELAHAAGTGREDDAEALGWLAGLRSGHPAARYSAALSALQRIAATGSAATRQRILGALPAPAAADLEAVRRARIRYERRGPARLAATVYDRWLRRTGQERGLESYDAAVDRLVQLELDGWLPPLP